MPKNIVIFSDGTGQEGGKGNPTNIYKLFNMVEDRTDRQIAFYDRGLGTDWRRITGNAFGVGISHNIQECYRFIFDNYQAGDHIYLFGFSRGAFTVRSLSGFIHHFGILPKSRPELIKAAYKIYANSKSETERHQRAEAFVQKHRTMWCTIKFIGVWDTVGALGVPYQTLDVIVNRLFEHEFHNTSLSQAVEAGYHALSIDDERLVFQPTLWDETTLGVVPVIENGQRIEKKQIVEQVWFAGVHTDIGGGYEKQGEPALSDIALEWIMKKAEAHDLLIYRRLKTDPDPLATLHDSRAGLARFYRKASRSQTEGLDKLKTLKVHQSVLDREEADRGYDPWILKQDYTVEPW